MKLASLDDGSRHGLLVVVSRDLSRCTPATTIVADLTEALMDWEAVADRLRGLAARLEEGRSEAWRFHEAQALAPVPGLQARDGESAPLARAHEPVVRPLNAGPLRAELFLAACCGDDGRARLVLPMLRLEAADTKETCRVTAASVAMTPDELDGATDPHHPIMARLQRIRGANVVESIVPLPQSLRLPRGQRTDAPSLTSVVEGLCHVEAQEGDRLRASLTDARRRPIAGVMEVTLDPPAPAMPGLGRSRPPLQPRG